MRFLVLVLASALLLAGCTSSGDEPATDPAPEAPAPNPGAKSPGGATGAAPPAQQHPPAHQSEPVQDAGDIAGPFAKAWNVDVASVAFREVRVDFALAGAQAGAPPTARVELALLDPAGNVVKTQAVGLGADVDSLSWTLRAADMPAPGTYVLQATSSQAAPAGLPSGGLAKYTLHAEVLY